jgi:hypothetical protein
MRYGGKGYKFDHYSYRPSFAVFNSRRSHETRILNVGKVDSARKVSFFFGEDGVNPYENILPYLTMEESQEVRAEQVKANIERGKRLKRRETPCSLHQASPHDCTTLAPWVP